MLSTVVMTREIRRFLVTGVVATAVHFIVAATLIERAHAAPALANAVAFVVATVGSYIMNTLWSFSAAVGGRTLIRFVTVQVLGVGLAAIVSGTIDALGLHYVIGIACVPVFVTPVTYFLHRHWTYRVEANETAAMKVAEPASSVLAERIGILAGVGTYLTIFNRTLPHGDAQRIVRQIERADLTWNPNHLLLDPLGYGFATLMNRLGLSLDPLASFEILSGVATLISLLLFHALLLRAGVRSAAARLLGCAGLFASHTFLTLAVNQYYTMVQMPLLLGVLYFYADFIAKKREGQIAERNLYGMGLLLALASAVMFNNLLLAVAAGLAVGWSDAGIGRWQVRYTAKLWGAAAALGFPLFAVGYLLSSADTGFFSWLLAYQGDASSRLNELYGLDLTAAGLAQATALVGFNTLLGAMLATAGLGTVLKVLAFGETFEFVPSYGQIALSILLAPAVIAFVLAVAWFAIRRVRSEPMVRFLVVWIVTNLAFNFLWVAGDDIFWGQILPAVWLLALLAQGELTRVTLQKDAVPAWGKARWRWYALVAFVPALLVLNTLTVVRPMADRAFFAKQHEHDSLLQAGDLEIVPGWDQLKWMQSSSGTPQVRKLVLMNMAVAAEGSPQDIRTIPALVDEQLRGGKRVIVARLYDKDGDLMPWYAMAEMGWPRARVQQLLADYCRRPLATIDGAVFHELYRCAGASNAPASPITDRPVSIGPD